MKQRYNKEAPVKVDGVYDVEIVAKGDKGDGMAKIEGMCVFIPRADVGEKVRVKIRRVLPKVAFAELVEVEDFGEETNGGEENGQMDF